MICIGRHVGGDTLALQHGRQNYFLLLSRKMFDNHAQMCWKCFHVIFSTISLKFKCKISVLKEVIDSFKNQFDHVTSCELTHFKKMVQVWKTKSQLFCLKYDPLMVFWSQNHITFFSIKMMSHELLVQMAFCFCLKWINAWSFSILHCLGCSLIFNLRGLVGVNIEIIWRV